MVYMLSRSCIQTKFSETSYVLGFLLHIVHKKYCIHTLKYLIYA